jgi:error-prone DNA polymerase
VYAPLWCKSNCSFLEGASHPEELVEEAHRLGIGSIALTDRDGVYGMVRAHVKARDLGVQLVCGAQISLAAPDLALAASPISQAPLPGAEGDDRHPAGYQGRGPGWGRESDEVASGAVPTGRRARTQRAKPRRAVVDPRSQPTAQPASRLVLLALDRTGWANLTRLVTIGRRRCDKGEALVAWSELCHHAAGLCVLWGGDGSAIADEPEPPAGLIGQVREAFGDRLYAMIVRHRQADEVARERRVRDRAASAGIPLIAATEVLYHSRARRPLQDVLTCIRHGVTLATAGRRIRGNAEHDLRAPQTFGQLFSDQPDWVARTLELAARATFSLAELRYRYPSERLPGGTSSAAHLRGLVYAGAAERFGSDCEIPPGVRKQLDAELALIEELDYPGYFLTMYEIVSYCRRRGILCQGRGSAANSAVCFCLGITAIDPVRMGLLFERFLSRERAEPPDIDLDIEHERREEVIQHVYAVYGRDHAAMVCNVIRYRPRSAVRDVGKVLGIPETALDRAAKQLSMYGTVGRTALAQAGLGEHGANAFEHLVQLSEDILEFPRHLSIHPGGFLLGHEPVHDIVPIENAAMPGRTVIQWDKDDLEELALFKVDLLALGALHQMHLAFDLLRRHRGEELTMATIPAEDEATYDMICTADTVGTFQIESRAQMSMLPRLRPRTFYDLVVEVSLVRPGPISGGMVHPYLRRRGGLEPIDYPHPSLEPVLKKTLGIPLFQEQVMKLAIVAADYTPGEADQLRRDMAAWRRSGRIDQHRERLVGRMEQKGIAREFAERVFDQIRGFGEYGFPESHAASFALIAYATSWLRKHRLPEFTCSLLNAQPMGFYSPATIVGDAQRHGLAILPIDATQSAWDATLEPAPPDSDSGYEFAVRMGLRWIKGLAFSDGQRIASARAERRFASLEDFVRRAAVPSRMYNALAEAGALAALAGPQRREALWQVAGWVARRDDRLPLGAPSERDDSSDAPDGGGARNGPDGGAAERTRPRATRGHGDAPVGFDPLSSLDEILWDYAASEHSTRGHPLSPMRSEMRARRWPDARTVSRSRDGQTIDYVGIVICRQQPGTASGVVFMTLEDETGFVNLVIWKQVFARYARVLRTSSLLGITGRLQVQDGIVHLIADQIWIPQLSRPIARIESRDFH